jgi:IS5 family transposase
VIPVFGYKNHIGIDGRLGFIRTFAVTDAAAHEGRQLGRLLDLKNTASPVWADSPYRSVANVALLARRGLVPHLQRPNPRGQPMPPHMVRGNASRARVRIAIEHVFATQKCRLGLVICSIGLARATARLGLANLVTQHVSRGLDRDPSGTGLRGRRRGWPDTTAARRSSSRHPNWSNSHRDLIVSATPHPVLRGIQ